MHLLLLGGNAAVNTFGTVLGLRKDEDRTSEVASFVALVRHDKRVLVVLGRQKLLVAEHHWHVDLLVAQGHFLALHLLDFRGLVAVFQVNEHHVDGLLLVGGLQTGGGKSVLEDGWPLLGQVVLQVPLVHLLALLLENARDIHQLRVILLQLLHGVLLLRFVALLGSFFASAQRSSGHGPDATPLIQILADHFGFGNLLRESLLSLID